MMMMMMMDELWKKHKIYATHTVAAAGSVALVTSITYPLDTLKVILQVGSGSTKQLTTTQAFERIKYLSGYSGLFNGLGWLVTGRILGMGARFGTYELIIAYVKDGRDHNYVDSTESLLTGIVAGAAESLVTSPFELVKIRSQVASASRVPNPPKGVAEPAIDKLLRGYMPDKKALGCSVDLISSLTNKHPNVVGALRRYPWMMTGSGSSPSVTNVRKPSEVVSLEGWGALWRGLRPGLVRDSVYGGVFFCTWEFIHKAMLDWKAVNMVPMPSLNEDVGPLSPIAVTLSAGFSGAVAAAASHRFDTAKCRSLCTVTPKFVSLERKFLKLKRPGSWFERKSGIHPADRNILYKGVWLRMARCGLGSLIVVGFYFLAIDELVSRGNSLT